MSGFSPLVPKQDNGTHSVTISFDLIPDDPCSNIDITWMPSSPLKVTVHTGNFSNTTFAWVDEGAAVRNQQTTIAPGVCLPVTGVADPTVGGTVSCTSPVLSGSNSTCTATPGTDYFLTGFSPNWSWSGTGKTCTVGPINDPTTVTGYFAASTGRVGCVGGTTIVGGVPQYNNYDSSEGNIDFTFDPDGTNAPSADGWGLRRGANYDGNGCVLVDYAFTQPTGPYSVASLLYDRTTGQAASWKYVITWPASAVDSTGSTTGWTTARPRVSWGVANPDHAPGSVDYVPGVVLPQRPG